MDIFRCAKCGSLLSGFTPSKCECGCSISAINGVYQFTDDKPISIDENGLNWLGYENVGANYEPGYANHQDDRDFGMFGACSKKLVNVIGKDKVVLDLGAGLGQASIPLALAGAQVIAVDISQNMLSNLYLRAQRNRVDMKHLICTRMNAYRLELADHSIDAIIEIDMLHQVNHPELVMEEIKRVLKPDGIYVKYGCKGLEVTKEQNEANAKCDEAEKDIRNYYESRIRQMGYGQLPFSSWEQARNCINDNFGELQMIETDEIQDWEGDLAFRLYKTKARASGSSQLIPDEIHNAAWRKTEEYAVMKYGEHYSEMKRYCRFVGYIEIYSRFFSSTK